MIDKTNGKAISIIDLDTVKPGLLHYDIGDCIRSTCDLTGEDVNDWETVTFDADICKAILEEYLSMTRRFLTPNDYDYIYDAIRLIPFELGLRYFTDYLEGNVYFKVKSPTYNLKKALARFKLTESIESQETSIRTIIKDLR